MQENPVISVHALNRSKSITFIVIVTIATVSIFGVSYLYASQSPVHNLYGLIVLGVIFVPLIFLGVIVQSYLLWKNEKITLFQDGIEYSTHRATQYWKWYELDTIQSGQQTSSTTGNLNIGIGNKIVLKLDDRFLNSSNLMEHVLQNMEQRINYQTAFEAGDTITAGKIHVNRKGVQLKNEIIAWGDIRAIRQEQFRSLQIDRQSGKTAKINTVKIPNAPVIIRFIATHLNELVTNTDPESLSVKPELALEARLDYKAIFGARLWLWVGILLTFAIIVQAKPTVLSIGFFGIASLIALNKLKNLLYRVWRNDSLIATADGIQHTWRGGSASWKWNEFTRAGLAFRPTRFIQYLNSEYALWQGDEVIIYIDNLYQHYADIGAMATHAVGAELYKTYKPRFDSGETLDFGTLQLSNEMIQLGNQVLEWDAISSYSEQVTNVLEFSLYNTDQNVLAKVNIYSIVNLNVALRLMNDKLSPFADQHDKKREEEA